MPNRIIKESICRSDSIDSLSWFEEVLFYRLIVVCDDFGRYDGRPAIIRGACFPLKDIRLDQIESALSKLSIAGMIRRYKVEDRTFLQLTSWEQHQQIRAKKSKYPAPDGICNQLISDDCNSPRNRESEYENRESYPGNGNARVEVCRFEEFWSIYPLDKSRYLAEQAYISVISDGIYTEDKLVESAKNYAGYCRITRTDKIYHADNFLKKCVFEDYLPEKYKKPALRTKAGFNDFRQNDYDFEQLEREIVSN